MNEKLSKILNHSATIPIATGVVSFGVGIGVGYILGKRNSEIIYKYNLHDSPRKVGLDLTADDLVELQEENKGLKIKGVSAEEALRGAEFAKTKIKETEIILPHIDPEEELEEVVTKNIFAESNDDWDYKKEIESRNESEPHVLHKDEFFAEELGYSQVTLTYYAGDDIMADQDDRPVYNFSTVTGPLLFGHGSGDPKVFYVRNDKRKAEYEIIHHPGHFATEVMGLEEEVDAERKDIKHSGSPRKFSLD